MQTWIRFHQSEATSWDLRFQLFCRETGGVQGIHFAVVDYCRGSVSVKFLRGGRATMSIWNKDLLSALDSTQLGEGLGQKKKKELEDQGKDQFLWSTGTGGQVRAWGEARHTQLLERAPEGLVSKCVESCSLFLAVASKFTAEHLVVVLELFCCWSEHPAVGKDWEWGRKEWVQNGTRRPLCVSHRL